MSNLKPCPFCGGEAVFRVTSTVTRGGGIVGYTFVVGCNRCGISLPKTYTIEFSINEKGELIPNRDDRETALELWNRRAENENK